MKRCRPRIRSEAIPPPWGDAELIILWRHIPFATPSLMPTIIARMTAAAADEAMPPAHQIGGDPAALGRRRTDHSVAAHPVRHAQFDADDHRADDRGRRR